MILQALHAYYERLAHDEEIQIPPFGYSREKISWAIVIDQDGKLVPPVLDLRITGKRKPAPKELIVPQRMKRASNITPNFLWDDSGYVLGVDTKGNPDRSQKTLDAFRARLHEVGDTLSDEGMRAVLRFVDRWNPVDAETLENWEEIVGSNIVFRLDGEKGYIHNRPAVQEAYEKSFKSVPEKQSLCLVTGQPSAINDLHPSIHGVRGAQSSGANIVSFNLNAFCSYGKKQGQNAPVGKEATFGYTTALNWLLRSDSDQKIQVADATTVFWAEKPTRLENSFRFLFDPLPEHRDDEMVDDRGKAAEIRVTLDAVRQGKLHELDEDEDVKFYILGLSPNSARISVRFWQVNTVETIARNLKRHFDEMDIEHRDNLGVPGLWQLLAETAVQNKLDNVPPLLGGAFMRAILTGGNYPATLLAAVTNRIRADQNISYRRMMLIKGCLIRNHEKEVSVSLNKEQTDPAYLLGRLFAILERAQEDASGGQLNTTIKDRYFSSASATPRTVFPILLRLNQHHVAKGMHGGFYTHLIGDIMELLPAENLPTHMPLEGQGLFAIGYYHQRNDLFKKYEKPETASVNQ